MTIHRYSLNLIEEELNSLFKDRLCYQNKQSVRNILRDYIKSIRLLRANQEIEQLISVSDNEAKEYFARFAQ